MLTVSVVIYNPDREIFRRFLSSLKKYTPELTQLIIFINSENHDEIQKETINYFSGNVSFNKVEENIGFGKAHNINLQKATGKYFAVINDDIEFFEPWATKMITKLNSDNHIAQVGISNDTCNVFSYDGIGTCVKEKEPDYIEGSCFIMSTDLAKEYGPFDDAYEMVYFEDADLSMRLKRDGYLIASVPVNWKHYRGKTSNKVPIDINGYWIRNQYIFRQRWNSYLLKKRFGKTIVIKRTGSIGDVFLVTPIAEALKAKYPDCVIILMTQTPQLVYYNPIIDFTINKVGEPFPCDEFIDLDDAYEKDFRKHIIEAYAEVADINVQRMRGILPKITEKDVQFVDSIISKKFGDFIVFELSTTWPAKQWSKDNYIKLSEMIHKDGKKIIGIGATGETQIVPCDLNLVNVLSLTQSVEVIKRAKIFIGHVGLMSHIAQAANIKNVILFGCELPEFASDLSMNGKYIPVVSEAACRGCRNRFNSGHMVICPRHDAYACMKMISVEKVYEAYEKLNV